MISHQGGSSPVQLAIATSIAMHYGHQLASRESAEAKEARRKRDAERRAKEKQGIHVDGLDAIESITPTQSLNRLA